MDATTSGRRSRKSCCIVGCVQRISNTSEEVIFYSFPGRPWEADRREKWIQAVNRKNPDGSRWNPTKKSFICSSHFIGGKKSQHPLSPSFLPTIFPKEYKVSHLTPAQEMRFERGQKRRKITRQVTEDAVTEQQAKDGEPENVYFPQTRDVATQTENFVVPTNDVNTYSKPSCKCALKPDMVDKGIDVVPLSANHHENVLHCAGFHGYRSLIEDETGTAILDLAGIPLNVFFLLISLLPKIDYRKISVENRLVIFLMKMKLGLSFSSLRVLFGIHRTTVSKIFKNMLSNLRDVTDNFVFWPGKASIMKTMPDIFKVNYPNCRVIIDCTEVTVEQPKDVDSRIALYSNYKSAFTIKFLVGISPSGMVTYVSKCYGGGSSDSSIVVDSKLLGLLQPGDEVMANKLFPGIRSSLEEKHTVLVMPPFLHNGRFSEQEVEETCVASVRVHVERMIQRLKIYNVLDKINIELLPYVDDIVRMCYVLANLQLPLIK